MRILYLTHRLPYAPDRGDRIRSYHTLRVLARRHEVHLFSLVHSPEEAAQAGTLKDFVQTTTLCAVRTRVAAAPRVLAALATSKPLTHALLDGPDALTLLRRQVSDCRPDMVLAYCSGVAQYAFHEPLQQLPLVVDFVDVDSEKWRQLGEGLSPKSWIYRREAATLARFEGEIIRKARATAVVNERERDLFAERGLADAVVVAPNGIDVDAFRRPTHLGRREKMVVFTAVFNYEPNARAATWLIRDIWPQVISQEPGATLALVGADPPEWLKRLANTQRSIHITGRVPDVRPYLWRASVSAAPILLSRGVQNKVLEAVAAGLPAVVTTAVREGLPAEVLDLCQAADTTSDFSAALVSALRQPAPAALIEERLRHLSWPTRLAPLSQAIEAVRTE